MNLRVALRCAEMMKNRLEMRLQAVSSPIA
jgi:hypothetical protein